MKSNTDSVYSNSIDFVFDIDEIDTTFHLLRQETPYKGSVLSKAQWNDLNGQNRLIVSIQDTNYADGFGKYELFAYQYTKKEGKWEINWKMNDFVKGMGCDLKIEVILTEILDIDLNGSAECVLIYTLDSRCDASCLPTKLLLYSNGEKLAIRGLSSQFLLPPLPKDMVLSNELFKGRDSANYKNIDATTFNGGSPFLEYASNAWDSLIKAENRENR